MKWNNLKNNKCPKCNSVLTTSQLLDKQFYCSASPSCNFRISNEKFEKIVNDLYKKKPKVQDNFEALQNFGHEEVTEDFSDSNFL